MPKPFKTQKIVASIHKNVHSKKWPCIIEECEALSINSHLLQKNGILDNVTVDGHLVEFKLTDIHSWSKNERPFNFSKLGVNKAFSLPLFCNNHDTLLFKSIETHPLGLDSFKVHLLLSYRVVCAELRKKEINVDLFTRILNSQILKGEINPNPIETSLRGSELGIRDLKIYKELFENEIEKEQRNFVFKSYTYPMLEVYGSAIFSPVDISEIDPYQKEPLNSVFVHIIPYNGELNIIVGYNSDYADDWIIDYMNSWTDLIPENLQKKLTNLFAAYIENWGTSPYLHSKMKKENLELFIEYSYKDSSNYSPNQLAEFNLFEVDN